MGGVGAVVAARKRRPVLEHVLSAYSWVSEKLSPWPQEPGLHQLRVWSGPLRGAYLRTPKLSRLSFALGRYQMHVTRALDAHARPGQVVYDLGAHIGYFSLVMSRRVGPFGRVFSFEPDPANLRALRRNLECNRADNVAVVPSVVAERSGSMVFAAFEFSSVSHIATERTPGDASLIESPSLALDDFVYRDGNPPPALMKVDVEGAEGRVLAGARRLLRESRPVVIVEVSPRTIAAVDGFFKELGYRSNVIGGDSQSLVAAGIGDLLFLP